MQTDELDATLSFPAVAAVPPESKPSRPERVRRRAGRHRAAPKFARPVVVIAGLAIMLAGIALALLLPGSHPPVGDVAEGGTATYPAVTSSASAAPQVGHLPASVIDADAKPLATHAPATRTAAAPVVTSPVTSSPSTSRAAAPAVTSQASAPAVTHTAVAAAVPGSDEGSRLLAEAEGEQGVPYVYGGDTPAGFDCSGLIYWSALRLGISSMPRDTYEMLGQGVSSGLLVLTSNPQPGDLAFFGSSHVELYVHAGETFGAQQPGTDVGFHPYGTGYAPTAFYRVT